MADLERCSSLELAVWGEGIVPASLLRAAVSSGGLVLGAWDGDVLAGYVFGFLGQRQLSGRPRLLHHSHVLAVLPAYRRQGLGVALKREQGRLAREQGCEVMTWTFDPLRARNAHLNLRSLGATAVIYEANYYGTMHDAQNGTLDSDRLLVTWWLDTEPAPRAVAGGQPRVLDGFRVMRDLDAPELLLPVPADLDRLLADDPGAAAAWRVAVREAFQHYLARGYAAVDFLEGAYVLRRP